jgi:hypothetical protein
MDNGSRPDAPPPFDPSAPWLSRPPVAGAILVDRHLHKNGGSTMRQVLLANERAGVCQYWGYWQTPGGWHNVQAQLKQHLLRSNGTVGAALPLPWLCVEVSAALPPARPTVARRARAAAR